MQTSSHGGILYLKWSREDQFKHSPARSSGPKTIHSAATLECHIAGTGLDTLPFIVYK